MGGEEYGVFDCMSAGFSGGLCGCDCWRRGPDLTAGVSDRGTAGAYGGCHQ